MIYLTYFGCLYPIFSSNWKLGGVHSEYTCRYASFRPAWIFDAIAFSVICSTLCCEDKALLMNPSTISCAAGEALDEIIMEALGLNGPEGDDGDGPGLLTQISRTMGSMQRFMKSLSN